MLDKLLFTLVPVTSSVILMMRTYAFAGRKKKILAVLSITFCGLVGVIIWVMSKQLTRLSRRPRISRCIPDSSMASVSLLFVVVKRTGCFAISDQPTVGVVPAAGAVPRIGAIQLPFAYHLAVRLGL